MTNVKKYILKDAIEQCFLKTKSNYLDFGDIKYLLSEKDLGRFPTKEKKKLYTKWNKELEEAVLKTPIYPFKRFSFVGSYLVDILKEMEKENRIKKTKNGYSIYKSPFGYSNAIRTQDKMNMDFFPPDHITIMDNMNIYGIIPFNVGKTDTLFEKIIASKIKKKLLEMRKKFNSIEEDFNYINKAQLLYSMKFLIKEIKKGNFSKKDKKMAYNFLKSRFVNRDTFNDFEWIKKNKKELIHYKNEDYFLTDKKLCNLLQNIQRRAINFFDPKPIVFTSIFDEKNIIEYRKIMNEMNKLF